MKNETIKKIFELDRYAVFVEKGEVFSSNGVKKYETKESTIWLINPNDLKINLSELEKLDNIKKNVFELNGMWACIIKNKLDNKIRAISSIHNEYPWYFAYGYPGCISNNIFILSKITGLKELDFASLTSFLAIDCSVSGFTLIKNILKNFGGDIIETDNKSLQIKKLDIEKWLGFDESIKDKRLLIDIFFDAINKSMDSSETQISLTAGSDSRAILTGAIQSKKTFNIMTGAVSTVSPRDIYIPSKISKLLKVNHIRVDASEKQGYSNQEMLNDVALITGTEFMPTNWILFHKEYLQDKENLSNITRILGYGGEVFKPRKDVTLTYPSKMSNLNTTYSDIVMDRVKSIYLDFNNLSKINARALYHLRGKFQFWEAVNTRTYSRFCHIYNPLSTPELYALAFRYVGGIESIQFHKLVYTYLPTEINKIPINVPKLIGYAYKFKRKFFRSTVNYNYYLTPDFIKKEIDYDMLGEIISIDKINKIVNQYELRGINAGTVHKMYALSIFNKIVNSKP